MLDLGQISVWTNFIINKKVKKIPIESETESKIINLPVNLLKDLDG